jgi:hypothetical protein
MPKRFTLWLAGAAAFLALASPLRAQASVDFAAGSGWMAGYVANAPHQLAGIGTWIMPRGVRGWGLYLDAKLAVESPARQTFLRGVTPDEAEAMGDTYFKTSSAWTSVNIAAVRGLSRELAVYLGAGHSWQTVYLQYVDDTGERGEFGQYWVEDETQSSTFPNVLGGVFFRLANRVVFQFGAESAPAGVTAGMHLLLR